MSVSLNTCLSCYCSSASRHKEAGSIYPPVTGRKLSTSMVGRLLPFLLWDRTCLGCGVSSNHTFKSGANAPHWATLLMSLFLHLPFSGKKNSISPSWPGKQQAVPKALPLPSSLSPPALPGLPALLGFPRLNPKSAGRLVYHVLFFCPQGQQGAAGNSGTQSNSFY